MSINKSDKQEEKEAMKQDLSQKLDNEGAVFVIHLLMKEKCEMPSKDYMTEIMQKHLGDVRCFCHDNKVAGFAPEKYKAEFKDGATPPALMIMECINTDSFQIDEFQRSQMWDCPDSGAILSGCKYHVIATDMLAGVLDYRDRAEMLVDYIEALAEMYPTCEAVYFQLSGKMFTREQIVNNNIPRLQKFIYYAVNARFFNIEGTDDKIVDTLGMSVLGMPDLQYHFHGIDPNWVVNHAYNVLIYMFENNCPFKNGDTVDGIENGIMSINVQWKCQYENSLIQPVRCVLDINMKEYAAGKRD